MSDLISRQTAIDALYSVDEYNSRSVKAIKQLPPIQTVNNSENPNSSDAISRQQAIDAVDKRFDSIPMEQTSEILLLRKDLRELPPAEPDIIYCKDCKHWIPYDWMFREVWQSKNIADYPEDEIGCNRCDMAMKADDFCSRAERREVTT